MKEANENTCNKCVATSMKSDFQQKRGICMSVCVCLCVCVRVFVCCIFTHCNTLGQLKLNFHVLSTFTNNSYVEFTKLGSVSSQ